MKRMLATLMVLSLSLALLAGCGSQGNNAASGSNAGANGETYTMRISHAVAETHPSHQTLLAFEKAVEEGTNGAVQVELIPNGALGGETQLAEMVQLGSLQGTVIGADARSLLKKTVEDAKKAGLTFAFGTEMEFYLFRLDEDGEPTKIPYDRAGYMDIAPADKGENVRREVCLTLERMGIRPESSHHEEGPGQNEIDFRYADPVTAADNAVTFRAAVDTVAARNGLYADFGPKPLADKAGNGMHINFSAVSEDKRDVMPQVLAGVLAHVEAMTAFLNPTEESYRRFGSWKAPGYLSWSAENRSQLIRVPAAEGEYRRAELRSPDPLCNPYLAFVLLIRAGMEGVAHNMQLPPAADLNLYTAPEEIRARYRRLPETWAEAKAAAAASDFIREHLPAAIIQYYT